MNAPLTINAAGLGAEELAQRYAPELSFFASPTQTLLVGPAALTLPHTPQTGLISRSEALLRKAEASGIKAMLVGAVPFDLEQAAHLFVPAYALQAPALARWQSDPPRRHCSSQLVSECIPSPRVYQHNVAAAIDLIRTGSAEKIVLSRSVSVEACINLPRLLQCLLCRNRLGYTYATALGQGRTLIGASPELLLSKRGNKLVSRPLAGSIPRVADEMQNRMRGAALLQSEKDLREHAVVVDAVAAALAPYCREMKVPAAPSLVETATMLHLGTQVEGELSDEGVNALELALALHPTPAVCGHPRSRARAFIQDMEGFERGFFAGLVGWSDARGDGEWAVTLRCAEVDASSATLYAGAGIVDGSDPALELAETSAKLRTMLGAMGLEHAVALDL